MHVRMSYNGLHQVSPHGRISKLPSVEQTSTGVTSTIIRNWMSLIIFGALVSGATYIAATRDLFI